MAAWPFLPDEPNGFETAAYASGRAMIQLTCKSGRLGPFPEIGAPVGSAPFHYEEAEWIAFGSRLSGHTRTLVADEIGCSESVW
jgi:hypothetical protein